MEGTGKASFHVGGGRELSGLDSALNWKKRTREFWIKEFGPSYVARTVTHINLSCRAHGEQ